jgi:hypothetical protein
MIELKLDLNEVNGILNALGQMPYVQVKDLIAKIQAQAQPQAEKKE